MSKTDALVVGLAQAVAIVPGVSRSGATIIAGILRGVKKSVIIEYTFLLALPTLGAAVVYDAYQSRAMLLSLASYSELIAGCVVALTAATVTLYFLRKYLRKISLTVFGWYRIVVAVLIVCLWYR
jgi:undecaprenyl-diphosphatase